MPCITYADLESLIKKDRRMCKQSKKILTTKIGAHIPCGY